MPAVVVAPNLRHATANVYTRTRKTVSVDAGTPHSIARNIFKERNNNIIIGTIIIIWMIK